MGNIKTYEIPGCISCRLKFALGKAIPFEAYFDGGIPDKGYPAVFMTSSMGQQLAIETSEMFRQGRIRIAKQRKAAIRVTNKIKKPASSVAAKEEEVEVHAAPANDSREYPEVTDLVGAIAVLKGEFGVSASRLKSEASVLRVAEEKNVTFPNLK